ncbi:M16 family metallopeptidase [Thiolapillus brandeum]|uniref:Peptidase M16 family protein n=1 Tax=Thiolapillus brandeum TaxID=1076588 RepID=A0A7U6GJL0_9GAMM|nr:pitrilysin family protein [Thiolapillus brandeum]BAO44831.1 peptidase M16 family protein [Thiolapillus brandeum]
MSAIRLSIILLMLTSLLPMGNALAGEKEAPIKGLPAYGKDKPLVLPQVVEKQLPNGLTLWLIERRGLPLLSLQLAVKGGSSLDPADRIGLSDILSSTISAGTQTRSSRQIAEELQALGADIDVGVGKDLTYVGIDGLASGADQLMEILADTARNASFPEDEVKLAIENERQSIIASKSQPSYDLNQVFYRQLFGHHPYAFVNPKPEVISRIDRVDLITAYRQRFQPGRAILVMVGDLSTREMETLAVRHLGTWKSTGKTPAEIPSANTETSPAILLVDRPHSVQSTIYLGRPMPPANNPDEFALDVANTIFGGAFGSRLTMNIREDKGYTYSPHASVTGWAKGGMFKVSASVRNPVTAATLVETFYELDRLATTLPEDEELSRAQRYLKGRFLLANETSASLTSTLTGYWIDGKTPADLARYVPGIEAINKKDVQAMGRKYLSSRKQVVAISGDAKAIKGQLSLFGKVQIVTP